MLNQVGNYISNILRFSSEFLLMNFGNQFNQFSEHNLKCCTYPCNPLQKRKKTFNLLLKEPTLETIILFLFITNTRRKI